MRLDLKLRDSESQLIIIDNEDVFYDAFNTDSQLVIIKGKPYTAGYPTTTEFKIVFMKENFISAQIWSDK